MQLYCQAVCIIGRGCDNNCTELLLDDGLWMWLCALSALSISEEHVIACLSGLDPAGCSQSNVWLMWWCPLPRVPPDTHQNESATRDWLSECCCGGVPSVSHDGDVWCGPVSPTHTTHMEEATKSLDERCKLTLSCVGSGVWALHPGQVRAKRHGVMLKQVPSSAGDVKLCAECDNQPTQRPNTRPPPGKGSVVSVSD